MIKGNGYELEELHRYRRGPSYEKRYRTAYYMVMQMDEDDAEQDRKEWQADESAALAVQSEPSAYSSEDGLYSEAWHRWVYRALEDLDPREAYCISAYFGLNGQDPMTYAQVGKTIGISLERARQIIMRGMRTLRHPNRYKEEEGDWEWRRAFHPCW